MIETIILAMLIAKVKGYKPLKLLKAWPVYIILLFEVIYVFSQIAIFKGDYRFLKYSANMEKPFLCAVLLLALVYKQYVSALIGSFFIFLGGILNSIVISANNGKMPVFPTLSYLTGYGKQSGWESVDKIHELGTASTKLKFLSDIFDIGYCIVSIGDIFIRFFVFIIIFSTIKHINLSKDGKGTFCMPAKGGRRLLQGKKY